MVFKENSTTLNGYCILYNVYLIIFERAQGLLFELQIALLHFLYVDWKQANECGGNMERK